MAILALAAVVLVVAVVVIPMGEAVVAVAEAVQGWVVDMLARREWQRTRAARMAALKAQALKQARQNRTRGAECERLADAAGVWF